MSETPTLCLRVVIILWKRMGSRLGPEYQKADGTPYASGTEYEFRMAIEAAEAAERSGRFPVAPEVLVYRRTQEDQVRLSDPERDEEIRQYEAVKSFFAGFRDADGNLRRSYIRSLTVVAMKAAVTQSLNSRSR